MELFMRSNLDRPDRLLGHRASTQSVHVADVFMVNVLNLPFTASVGVYR